MNSYSIRMTWEEHYFCAFFIASLCLVTFWAKVFTPGKNDLDRNYPFHLFANGGPSLTSACLFSKAMPIVQDRHTYPQLPLVGVHYILILELWAMLVQSSLGNSVPLYYCLVVDGHLHLVMLSVHVQHVTSITCTCTVHVFTYSLTCNLPFYWCWNNFYWPAHQ